MSFSGPGDWQYNRTSLRWIKQLPPVYNAPPADYIYARCREFKPVSSRFIDKRDDPKRDKHQHTRFRAKAAPCMTSERRGPDVRNVCPNLPSWQDAKAELSTLNFEDHPSFLKAQPAKSPRWENSDSIRPLSRLQASPPLSQDDPPQLHSSVPQLPKIQAGPPQGAFNPAPHRLPESVWPQGNLPHWQSAVPKLPDIPSHPSAPLQRRRAAARRAPPILPPMLEYSSLGLLPSKVRDKVLQRLLPF